MKPVVAIIAVLCLFISTISALQCYKCHGSGADDCVTKPSTRKTVSCHDKDVCVIEKMVSKDASVVERISRMCGSIQNHKLQETYANKSTLTTESCSKDFCNAAPDQRAFWAPFVVIVTALLNVLRN